VYKTDKQIFNAIPPAASVNGAGFTSNVIDTQGYEYLELLAIFGAIGANVALLKVQESDAKTNATTLTAGADVPGTVVGTDTKDDGTASALPALTTDNNKVWKFEIDLRGRKRYLQIQCTAGAGATFLTAIAELGRGAQLPTTAAQKGAAAVMRA
jgi:hypothetical protein